MQNQHAICSSDKECIVCFMGGDERGFTELVKHNRAKLTHYVNSYVHNYKESEDIVQDVFIDIFLFIRSGNYKEEGKFAHLLASKARRRALDFVRHRKHLSETPFPDKEEAEHETFFEEPAEEHQYTPQELSRMYAALKLIKEKKRRVLMLRYMENKSYDEIGKELGMNSHTASSDCVRAVKKLRKILRVRSGNK